MKSAIPIRDSYVAKFGEQEATAIEAAANQHADRGDTIHTYKEGDRFKWALCVTSDFGCYEDYRKEHGIEAPADQIKKFALEECDLNI